MHFLTQCPSFEFKRRCYLGKLSSIGINIESYDCFNQAAIMLCPTTSKQAKLTNKFVEIMFNARKSLDEGATIDSINGDTSINISLDSAMSDLETDD